MRSSFSVQRFESLHTYICFLFPLVHLLWSVTPAEHNETQNHVFCCSSEPQFKLWCLALISQKLTDAGSTQRRAESWVSCSAVFVMLIIFYWRWPTNKFCSTPSCYIICHITSNKRNIWVTYGKREKKCYTANPYNSPLNFSAALLASDSNR